MTTPFDTFQYRDGILYAEDVPLTKIIEAVGTPTYVYSQAAFLNPLRELQKNLSEVQHLVCFAVKSNSNIAVLKLLSENGAGMDIVSAGELYRAGIAGIPGERIVFSGVGKTREEIQAALQYQGSGILSFHVESIEEMTRLNSVAGPLGRKASFSLRFNPDVDAKTHPYISTGLRENKFGLPLLDIKKALAQLSKSPHLELEGLSIHIGSQLTDLGPLRDAYRLTLDLIVDIEKTAKIRMKMIDFGGGLGITYSTEKPPAIADYCQAIKSAIADASKKHKRDFSDFRFLIEPGRSISGNAGVLLSEVLYRKSGPAKEFLVIDAAMNDLIRPTLYQGHHEVVPIAEKERDGKSALTDVVGPICETGDFLARNRDIPLGIQSGSLLAILSAGAYGFTMSSQYNSRPRAAEVLVSGDRFRIIRDRESYSDLIKGEGF